MLFIWIETDIVIHNPYNQNNKIKPRFLLMYNQNPAALLSVKKTWT